MKKGYQVILAITLSFIFLVCGVFLGRRSISGTLSVETSKYNTHTPKDPAADDVLSNGKININRAGVEELSLLPGIGETIAQRIIAYRTIKGDFESIDDLMNVEGIGEVRLSQISKYITVTDE